MQRWLMVVAGSLLAWIAQAQTASSPPPLLAFTSLDRSADQRVTEAEFMAAGAATVARRFAGIDRDGNGALSSAEVEHARIVSEERLRRLAPEDPARAEYAAMPALAEMDANGDGQLDRAEFEIAQARSLRHRFQLLDRNGDRALDAAEFDAARSRFLQQVGRPAPAVDEAAERIDSP